jgi:hypothetical protein
MSADSTAHSNLYVVDSYLLVLSRKMKRQNVRKSSGYFGICAHAQKQRKPARKQALTITLDS